MTGGILLMLQSFWTAINAQGFLYIVVFAGFLCFIKSISWDQSMVNLPLYIEFISMVNLGQSNSKYTLRPMDPSWLWNVWVVKGVWTNWDSTARSSPTSQAESTPPPPGMEGLVGIPETTRKYVMEFSRNGKDSPWKKVVWLTHFQWRHVSFRGVYHIIILVLRITVENCILAGEPKWKGCTLRLGLGLSYLSLKLCDD